MSQKAREIRDDGGTDTGTDTKNGALVVVVDDDRDLLRTVETLLKGAGYRVLTAQTGAQGLEAAETHEPALVLLDINMPGMDGYETCRRMRRNKALEEIPIVFVTTRTGEQNRHNAFAVGASGYVEKPFDALSLLTAVKGFIEGTHTLVTLSSDGGGEELEPGLRRSLPAYPAFREWLPTTLPGEEGQYDPVPEDPSDLHSWGEAQAITGREIVRRIGEFTGIPVLPRIDPEDLELGMLPRRFSFSRLVLPVRSRGGRQGLIISNPFDWQLWNDLEHTAFRGLDPDILLAAPEVIREIFKYGSEGELSVVSGDQPSIEAATLALTVDSGDLEEGSVRDPGENHPVARLAMAVLSTAAAERASDIHIEPKPSKTLIRARIDGDMHSLQEVPAEVSSMLISRFKALAGMDIAERRKPQDGGMEIRINGRSFKLRLATTSTPHGESLVIRLLEPTVEPKKLEELGMTVQQAEVLKEMAERSQGLILLVGPTGSGKSTTIYSLLSLIDTRRRSLMSVEDPVEYRIAFANQQQVTPVAGVTFESLLRSAVRQDPDILFLGEMRDLFSAKASMDFASSGHLTVTSMHSSNSTTAIFRLERLGVARTDMSEALIAVVAQKLLKRLCPECREVRPITPEERELLRPFTQEIPEEVAQGVGCPACRQTGYHGREGVYEILKFDTELSERVRDGFPISDIRQFARERGQYFISDHVLEKIRKLKVSVQDAYEKVLVEESVSIFSQEVRSQEVREGVPEAGEGRRSSPHEAGGGPRELDGPEDPSTDPSVGVNAHGPGGPDGAATKEAPGKAHRILVVEDDADTRALLERFLTGAGFEVLLAEDGVEALLTMGRMELDLILSDINMPNLDGLKLLEIVTQQGRQIPVVLLSADREPEVEVQGLELGAADFIHKPIRKEVVVQRLRRVLGSPGPNTRTDS